MQLLAQEPQLRSVNTTLIGGATVAAGSAATSILTGFGCPSFELFGVHCGFCGATRCLKSVLDGDLAAAMQNNVIIVVGTALVLLRFAVMAAGGRDLVDRADSLFIRVDLRVWIWGVLAYAVARNLPWLSVIAPIAA